MTDPLYHEARRLIAELELVSHAPTRSYDSDGRGGGDQSRAPVTGHKRAPRDPLGHRELDDHEPAFIPLRRRLRYATTDHALERIITDAKQELDLAKRASVPAKLEHGTIAWRRHIANSTLGATELARLHGISRQYVYELRAKYQAQAA